MKTKKNDELKEIQEKTYIFGKIPHSNNYKIFVK